MTDPLYGSVSQLWPAIPVPAFGYAQSPLAASTRPFSSMSPGLGAPGAPPLNPTPTDLFAYGGGPPAGVGGPSFGTGVGGPNFATGQNFGTGLSAVVSNPVAGSVPAYTGSEIAIGVPAPAVLMAVAIRRGQPLGPTNDQEIEDFIYDAFDLLPGATDVEVRCEGGRATLTGTVPHKRLKRDVGEIAWAIPSLNDVQNNVTITARRRSRASSREGEAATAATRKPA